MNVTFHTTGALASAAFLSSFRARAVSGETASRDSLLLLVIGFIAGVAAHGVMDYVPHSYPISSGLDVVLSIILFIVAVAQTKPQFRVLVTACFIGSVFPDLVDLGPSIVNRHLGWSLPTVRIFPWHCPRYSVSLYHGAQKLQSYVSHCAVLGFWVSLCWFYRYSLFSSGSERTPLDQ